MKKVIVALAVVVFAQTVQALDISCTCDFNKLATISYDATGDEPRIRAFALDIVVGGNGTISDVVCLSHKFGYQIYPGSIQIDASGNVADWGSCRCSGDYPGTLDDVNAMTIEMASAYEPGVDPDPCDVGDLVSFVVDGTGTIYVSMSVNEIRSGVVKEDASITTPNITGCWCDIPARVCWDYDNCAGQPVGDGTCDGSINFADLIQLKQGFGTLKGQANYNCCADYDQNERINFGDLIILKQHFGTSGYTPSTGIQECPP